ncbi:Hypothetical predicted protein [Paramuricea clavata]|uniref:Uncharacterized protein n=1 Tax=Paramuricea clavata TaxID=317549 RepID=A0A6S7K228_PARCT|nr:Hypothetical predicted protein [Paramuricea clavata]
MAKVCTKKLREIALQLVKEIANERKDSQEDAVVPSDELFSALHVVFPQTLQQAVDLVDRDCVTKVISASGRELFQCKHVLAVYISQNLETLNERNISDEDFAKILTEVND